MKLSTRARYGTRALLVLALNYTKKPLLLKEIAKNQEISVRYLENIMTLLLANGIVRSMRGKNGGFTLAKDPVKIHLGEVVRILEGSIAPVACTDNPALCKHSSLCVTHDIWKKMEDAVADVLDNITLAEMVEMHKKKFAKTGKNMYYI